jgi:alkylation response protein AidB-like acyl-CoA dehydrogenase
MTAALTTDNPLADDFFKAVEQTLHGVGLPDVLLADGPRAPLDRDPGWRAACQAGWFTTMVSDRDGGLGLGLVELGALFRAVGHRLLRGPLFDHAVTVPMLLPHAVGAARQRLLRALDGSLTVTLAQSPPPPYGLGPAAVQVVGGVLSGRVELVPFALAADAFVLVALDGHDLMLALIPASEVERTPTASADPCIDYGTVTLNDLATDRVEVVARGAQAEMVLGQIHGALRLAAGAHLAGVTAEMTSRATEYAKARVQFGRPVGGFQAIRHILAEMQGRVASLRSLSDACLAEAAADPSRTPECGRALKGYSSRPSRFIAEQAHQVYGGMGFTWEVPLHLYLRRVLTLEGYLGESTDLLIEIGKGEIS